MTGDLWENNNNDLQVEMNATLFDLDMTDERKAVIRRAISRMTKKQITGVLNRRFKLKWDDPANISAVTMKESFANVLFLPASLYDSIAPMHRLLTKAELFMYTVPMDDIKIEINKLLRKACLLYTSPSPRDRG